MDKEKLRNWEIDESEENYFAQNLKQYLELNKIFREYKLSQKTYQEAIRFKKSVESKLKSNVARSTDLNRTRLLVLLRKEETSEKKNAFYSLKK